LGGLPVRQQPDGRGESFTKAELILAVQAIDIWDSKKYRKRRRGRMKLKWHIARVSKLGAELWEDAREYFLGPLFIGISFGFGVCLGRALFLTLAYRTNRLLGNSSS